MNSSVLSSHPSHSSGLQISGGPSVKHNYTGSYAPSSSPVPFIYPTPETLIFSSERENHSHPHVTNSQANESLSFILIPLIVIFSVALFSALTIYCIQRRKRLDNLRHTLIPLYTYTRDDDDWGVLLDDQRRENRRSHR